MAMATTAVETEKVKLCFDGDVQHITASHIHITCTIHRTRQQPLSRRL